ncbi:hypothetical protein HK098_007496 [Nowakowskiella sp. JEL0407]|nr:hypothetical protein HK098_007496 [Nowakowskiella sp. JEL0407]
MFRIFSRYYSSINIPRGPGGQNVNKVSTKVDLRFVLNEADWIPAEVKEKIREQQFNKINKKDELLITSDRHRTQLKNIEDCFAKLEQILSEAQVVKKETSEDVLERIKEFKVLEKVRTMDYKKKRSDIKSSRKFRGDF